jgi:putative hydrolase of the HAD superfamily
VTRPGLVVFDLGGVVVRICRSWTEGCRAAGVEPRTGCDAAVGGPAMRALVDRHQRGAVACDAFFRESAALLGAHTPGEVERVHRAWILGDYPGVADAIDRIHAAGLATSCLSNTNASHWEQLRLSPAFMRIGSRHASHLLGLAKPNPAIYRAFEREVGAGAGSLVLFDDLPENVAAARACGWTAFEVDHAGDTAAQVTAALRGMGWIP